MADDHEPRLCEYELLKSESPKFYNWSCMEVQVCSWQAHVNSLHSNLAYGIVRRTDAATDGSS